MLICIAQSNYHSKFTFSACVWKQFCTHTQHATNSSFCLFQSPLYFATLFPPFLTFLDPLPTLFLHIFFLVPPFSVLVQPKCFPASYLSSYCWLDSEPRVDLEESEVSGCGTSFQSHNTRMTLCDHAKINLPSIHHLTLSLKVFEDVLPKLSTWRFQCFAAFSLNSYIILNSYVICC